MPTSETATSGTATSKVAEEENMSLDDAARERIRTMIDSGGVVLFMKGSREAPRCGFSATVVQILDQLIPEYGTVDVLADEELRENIKEYSSWPTVPQLYVRGEFIGGCDIVTESFASGDLQRKLGIELGDVDPPSISIDDDAAEELRNAAAQAPDDLLGPGSDDDVALEANGVTLCMDRLTASRATDAHIDMVKMKGGNAFRVGLPHAPTPTDG
jgi:monothiol glutaredoxin